MLEPSKGKTKISGVYRVKQPIENFRIRVRIVQQKSLLAELFENEGETRDSNFLEDESREFAWQEKVLGPREQNEHQSREVPRLYSHVQADDAYQPDASPLTSEYRSRLSTRNARAAPPAPRNRKPFAERHDKSVVDERPSDRRIRENHYLYKEHERMYIVVDLSPKDESNVEPSDSEALLCSLTYDPLRKTLRVNPDFTTDECYSVDGVGMSYDYWIEHASPRPSARESQRRRDIARKETRRLREPKEAQLFHELHAPRPRTLRLQLSLDIEAARGFERDDGLFVSYFLDLPSRHWRAAERAAAGRTQRCRPRNGTANFSYCAEIALDLDLSGSTAERNAAGWPSFLFSVASLDGWTRYRIEGYGSLALPSTPGTFSYTLNTWRPSGGLIDGLRRFFTGGTCELDDITYCAVPAMHEGPILDKTNLRVVPSGNVQLRIGAVHQSQEFARNRGMDRASAERLSAGKLMSSVDDVLSQFKAARERMIQARAMCS